MIYDSKESYQFAVQNAITDGWTITSQNDRITKLEKDEKSYDYTI
jgi:hypothetical protein